MEKPNLIEVIGDVQTIVEDLSPSPNSRRQKKEKIMSSAICPKFLRN